jgi:predicted RNA binding protein YcfA (HicA-like mRNA interferase family)
MLPPRPTPEKDLSREKTGAHVRLPNADAGRVIVTNVALRQVQLHAIRQIAD